MRSVMWSCSGNDGRVNIARPLPSPRRSVLASQLVGRDSQLRQLGEAVNGAAAGRGGVVFVVGEAGIGKSRLVQAMSAEAEAHGVTVLRGRAVEAATPLAYRPIAEALCSMVRSAGCRTRRIWRRIGGCWGAWSRSGDLMARSTTRWSGIAEAVLRFLRATAGDRGCVVVFGGSPLGGSRNPGHRRVSRRQPADPNLFSASSPFVTKVLRPVSILPARASARRVSDSSSSLVSERMTWPRSSAPASTSRTCRRPCWISPSGPAACPSSSKSSSPPRSRPAR